MRISKNRAKRIKTRQNKTKTRLNPRFLRHFWTFSKSPPIFRVFLHFFNFSNSKIVENRRYFPGVIPEISK